MKATVTTTNNDNNHHNNDNTNTKGRMVLPNIIGWLAGWLFYSKNLSTLFFKEWPGNKNDKLGGGGGGGFVACDIYIYIYIYTHITYYTYIVAYQN